MSTSLKQRRLWLLVPALGIVGAAAWAFSGSSGATHTDVSAAKGNDAPVLEGNLIHFSDAFAKRSGLTSEVVTEQELTPYVTAVGALAHDPRRFAAVGARIGGRVRRVFKYAGDEVKSGDKLAEIESVELGQAEANMLAMRAKEKAALADTTRERRLADAKVTSERDAELAQATYEAVSAERIAAERALAALGGQERGQTGVLVLRSPIAGRVIQSRAALGKTTDATETLFEVADVGSLWVELQVFERDLTGIQVGNAVEVRAPGIEELIGGKVAHVGEVIEPETRTAPVRVVVSNEQGKLRAGQSVMARIHTDAAAVKALTVPRAALTRIDGKPTVFVLHDANTVEARGVTAGPEDVQRVAVNEGLKPGELVVVGGMFALKSEIFR